MNEQIGERSLSVLDGLVVETGTLERSEGKVPFTVFYLGRFIEPLTLHENGLPQFAKCKLEGELVSTEVTYRRGTKRQVRFLAKAKVVEVVK